MLYSELETVLIRVSRQGCLGPSAIRERRSEESWLMVARGLIRRLIAGRNRITCLIGTILEEDDKVRPRFRRLLRREGGGGSRGSRIWDSSGSSLAEGRRNPADLRRSSRNLRLLGVAGLDSAQSGANPSADRVCVGHQ